MDVIIHWYLNFLEKNNANVKGTNTAVARNPIDKNPRSLMKVPEKDAATTTDINNIPMMVSRETARFLDDSLNEGFIFMKTSRTNMVDDPSVNPEIGRASCRERVYGIV